MGVQVQEKEAFELPTVNPWLRRPTRDQVRFAMDLCRSELPYAERTATLATFDVLDRAAMSDLIDRLKDLRGKRLARLRRIRRPRR